MITSRIVVRGTTESDWERVRSRRSEILADTTKAFGEALVGVFVTPERRDVAGFGPRG